MISRLEKPQYTHMQTKQVNFGAKINSPSLQFSSADFFVNIRGYGKDKKWADITKQTAETAVYLIRNKCSFDNLMRFITAGIIKANNVTKDINKKEHTGILRTKRESYRYGSDWSGLDLYTNYNLNSRYKIYEKKLNQTITNPLTNPYPDIELSIPVKMGDESLIKHASSEKVNIGLDIVEEKYYQLLGKYKPENVTSKNLKDISNKIAEIRWLMAHIMPWERGSDTISNVFMRALFKTFGIKTSPSIKNLSFDLEAYCTNLEDYKQKFPEFFSKKIKVVE